ncbi:MAG: hypothetical protein LBS21_10690 [Clostridiales bacterium]|nr:hypothetical protein [Clostridiales bacterium]
MNNHVNGLLKAAGVTALTLVFAVSAFTGVNHLALSAATLPEKLPALSAQIITAAKEKAAQNAAAQTQYNEPQLTVILDENFELDQNGNPCVPDENAMSPEEAAQIGALYILDMTGESIDGKTVEMSYIALPFYSKTYWRGSVLDSAAITADEKKTENSEPVVYILEDGSVSTTGNNELYSFSIDAVTGERIAINPGDDVTAPENYGEGKLCHLTRGQLEAMRYIAPANADDYAEIARAFAEKHFNHSTVERVEFSAVTLNQGSIDEILAQNAQYAKADHSKPFAYTLYEKGRYIIFNVTDSSGRFASVEINADTKRVSSLSTSDNDIVPGYPNYNPESAG